MQSARATRVSWDGTVLVTSVAVMLMGLGVIVGWHAHIPAFIRLFPGTIPMQYNTALCFLALGAAGVGLSTRRRLWLLSGGSIAALMGAAVILEYATGMSFGIDTFFFYPWERTLSADPGRMALTTAISFLLTAVALVILAVRQDAYAIFGIINSIPLSLALTSLVGYAFQITYVLPFSLGSQMALHTALGVSRLRHRDAGLRLEVRGRGLRMACRSGRRASAWRCCRCCWWARARSFQNSRGESCRSRHSSPSSASRW